MPRRRMDERSIVPLFLHLRHYKEEGTVNVYEIHLFVYSVRSILNIKRFTSVSCCVMCASAVTARPLGLTCDYGNNIARSLIICTTILISFEDNQIKMTTCQAATQREGQTCSIISSDRIFEKSAYVLPQVRPSVCLSVCLSVCPHVSARLLLHGFPWNLILVTFMKSCQENSDLVEIRQKYRTLYTKTYVCFIVADDIKSL
jgi:hypothetical protein